MVEVGEVVLMYEEMGSNKGTFQQECEVLSKRDYIKLYFIREIDTGSMFLQNRNKLRPLREIDPENIAIRRLEGFTFKMKEVNIPGILVKPKTKRKKKYGVTFDSTCHMEYTCLLVGTVNC